MIITIVILSLLSIVAIFYCIRFGLIILDVQDAIEESLDIIDEKYASMTSILERPLFYDSPEVRQVLRDIKGTRTSLHIVAASLSKNFQPPEDEEDEDREVGEEKVIEG